MMTLMPFPINSIFFVIFFHLYLFTFLLIIGKISLLFHLRQFVRLGWLQVYYKIEREL